MLTPRFKISQTNDDITLNVHAPYTDVNESEVHVEENLVCFYAAPYYLRLHLPGPVVEDDQSKGSFDATSGDYIVTLSKRVKGQHFEDLDMINALIKPPSGKSVPIIELLKGDRIDSESASEISDFDWFIEQELPIEEKEGTSLLPTYGFANRNSGIFSPLESELPELLDILTPDSTDKNERESLQQEWEDQHFSPEHFLADWAEEDEIISPLINTPPPWQSEDSVLTPAEQERLIRLPQLDILELTPAEQKSALLGLAELIFCWAYEQISSLGDTSPESARSIRRLSSTLSWLRSYSSAKKLALSCFRRALCIPLYRNWSLATKTMEHCTTILKSGKVSVLKCLLSMHLMFAECESYHVHSQLYLEPYIIWIQSVPIENLNNLAVALEKSNPLKADLNWDLEELEAAGKVTLEEEKNSMEILTKQLKSGLHIKASDIDSDDSSDSEWESSSESSSETSSEEEESSCSNEDD